MVEKHTREVAAANRELGQITQKIAILANEFRGLLNKGDSLNEVAVNVESMMTRRYWLEHLERQQEELESDLALAQETLQAKREQLTRSWRDLEILEKLRDKQKLQWREEMRKRENRELDEIGQIRADRLVKEKVAEAQAEYS